MAKPRKATKQRTAVPRTVERKPTERRIALFVEGTNLPTPRNRDDLVELWRHQCGVLSAFPRDHLDVYGFTKQQIVIMSPEHDVRLPGAGKIPLDVMIERRHREKPFDGLVIAFDAYPANQAIALQPPLQTPCLRVEKDFVLRWLARSKILPQQFRDQAACLLAHYDANRALPRAAARPPMGELELLYMDPTFEALVLEDPGALRAVFGFKKTPTTWPALPPSGSRPDFVLRTIVQAHHKIGPKHLRLRYDAAKHAWAHEILKHAAVGSAIWQHPIAARLKKVLS